MGALKKPVENASIVPFTNLGNYSKSNYLISAKYQSTLLENQILAMSLQRVHMEGNNLISEISASEIKVLLGKTYQDFYIQLKKTALRLLNNVIMIEDPEKRKFKGSNIITDCESEDGNFKITYNIGMKDVITGLKNNFTRLNLDVMIRFTSSSTFRLYELLKSKCYHPKGVEGPNIFQIEYDIAELKITLGAVDITHPQIAPMLNGKETPNYKKILEEAAQLAKRDSTFKKPKFEKWYDFKRQVIDIGVEEINEKSDIHVIYNTLKTGKGGKVSKIIFVVTAGQPSMVIDAEEKTVINPDELIEKLDILGEVIEEHLPIKDLKTILETADYDISRVEKAYQVSKKQKNKIHNLTAYLIMAIRDEYDIPVSVVNKKGTGFNNFNERQYDFDELEKELLDNGKEE